MHLLCQTRCLKCSNSFIIRVWSLALCLWQASALRVSVRVQRSSDALLCNEMSCAVVNATRCVARHGRNGPVDGNACMQHVNSITRRWNRCSVAIALHRGRGRDDAEVSIWSTFSHSECSFLTVARVWQQHQNDQKQTKIASKTNTQAHLVATEWTNHRQICALLPHNIVDWKV